MPNAMVFGVFGTVKNVSGIRDVKQHKREAAPCAFRYSDDGKIGIPALHTTVLHTFEQIPWPKHDIRAISQPCQVRMV